MPQKLFRFTGKGNNGALPQGLSFRVWRIGQGRYGYEAVNRGKDEASFAIIPALGTQALKELRLAPGLGEKGLLLIDRD
jgi:hypothetical protein